MDRFAVAGTGGEEIEHFEMMIELVAPWPSCLLGNCADPGLQQ
jgi:hypothetical protein